MEGDMGGLWTPQHRKNNTQTPHHRKKFLTKHRHRNIVKLLINENVLGLG